MKSGNKIDVVGQYFAEKCKPNPRSFPLSSIRVP